MNILRTIKRLAAATKCFSGKKKFVKFRKSLYAKLQNKSEQKSLKVLAEKHIFGKTAKKKK